jgi:hypothetical protein
MSVPDALKYGTRGGMNWEPWPDKVNIQRLTDAMGMLMNGVKKAQNAMPHDQGALMSQDKKEEARGPHGSRDERNSWLREQMRSPETPPRAAM